MGLATRCNCDRPEPGLRQSMAPALENSSGLSVRQGQRSIKIIASENCTRRGLTLSRLTSVFENLSHAYVRQARIQSTPAGGPE